MGTSEYSRKFTSAEKAVACLKSGDTIVTPPTPAEPPMLMAAIANRIREEKLTDISIYTLFPNKDFVDTLLTDDLHDRIKVYTFFVGLWDRELVKKGFDHFVPNYFYQVPRLLTEFVKADIVISTVSPMDNFGFFSFGVVNDYISTAARNCKHLLVESCSSMPRVFGDSLVHISDVEAVVENDYALLEVPPAEPRPEAEAIGRYIAELIPDEATLQLGLGAIPNAITKYLEGHKDLGLHTEVFMPGMVDLIEKGIITGRKKTVHPRKHVFTTSLGTRRMYDFMDNNPSIESYPVSHTNDPKIIAQNHKMISINATIEVDLFGQCNSEQINGFQFSGTGGQLDYVRGAFNSKGGKSFLAFYSTCHKGEISRVVAKLASGAIVTTPRMDTDYLVTEQGVAHLKGKSTRERALAIIEIAHPKFRDDLLKQADQMHLM